MDALFQPLFNSAKPYLDTRHNLIHTGIVVRFAERLIALEGGDMGVIVPAAILHDVGWSEVPESLQLTAFGPHATDNELNRAHEISGVKIARSILESARYGPNHSEKIFAIIDGHDSNPKATSVEDAVVKDADKLRRYSEAGFRIDCRRFNLTAEQSLTRLRQKIPVWFHTASGRRIAETEWADRERESRG